MTTVAPAVAVDATFHDVGDRFFRLGDGGGHDHALARGQAVRLDHDRRALLTEVGAGGG